MTLINLGFSYWPYPGKRPVPERFSWGACGLLAHSIGPMVTIYAIHGGIPAPLDVLPPFDADITAIAWFDSSGHFGFSIPVLLVGTATGKLSVFDLRTQKVVDTFVRKADHFTCLVWSQFSASTFFAGTSAGYFIQYELQMDEIVRSRMVWEIKTGHQVDFICLEPVAGAVCAVASNHGNV
jgi:hypothetical protein